ncbi:hypothetical protein K9M79_03465 [Candidatus Woesearchaeota archaeon]|nr:hypothetical protein [Candidatus Woesearchaeota archaeon]
MKELLNTVLTRLKPEKTDIIDNFRKKVLDIIHSNRKYKNIGVFIGGSVGKNTYIKNDFDCDVFIQFARTYMNDDLSDILEDIIKETKIPYKRIHGSRDYFSLKYKGITFELVPVYKINTVEQAQNITDFSPMHVQWILNKIRNTNLQDQIRLAKQFFKSSGLYGAESYLNGFSGHVIDIMTIYYGGFIKLLEAASKWQKNEIIDIENHHEGENIIKILNKSKIQSPLIIIDPIQKERNAAAALSRKKYDLFIQKAREFLRNPSSKFFNITRLSIAKLKNKYHDNLIILEGDPLEGSKDVVGCKILKVYNYIRKQLKTNGFEIHVSNWHWNGKDKFLIWFQIDNLVIDNQFVQTGPPLERKFDCDKFKGKHPQHFEERNRLYARVSREYNNAISLIGHLIHHSYIISKVTSIYQI